MTPFVINTAWGLSLFFAGTYVGAKLGRAFAQREAAVLLAMLATGAAKVPEQPAIEVEGGVQ